MPRFKASLKKTRLGEKAALCKVPSKAELKLFRGCKHNFNVAPLSKIELKLLNQKTSKQPKNLASYKRECSGYKITGCSLPKNMALLDSVQLFRCKTVCRHNKGSCGCKVGGKCDGKSPAFKAP